MPLYDFSCRSCGHVIEDVLMRTTQWAEMPCPKCDGVAHRLPSAPGRVTFAGRWLASFPGGEPVDFERMADEEGLSG